MTDRYPSYVDQVLSSVSIGYISEVESCNRKDDRCEKHYPS